MVLESLIQPKTAEKKPLEMMFLGFIYSSVAILLSLWIFESQASMIFVFLTVLAAVPFMYNIIIREEKKDIVADRKVNLLWEHGRALIILTSMFIGFVLAFTLWFIFLPAETVQNLFSTQLQTIAAINTRVTGGAASTTFLIDIISNNFKVLFFCIFFSFFYGAGAIFILTWNASVISAAIGSFIRDHIGIYAEHMGMMKVAGYFSVFGLGLFRYMNHGFWEILAYFVGGLAGGLISVAVIRHSFGSVHFRKVMKDSLRLIIIAAVIIIIAGLIEVYVTPKIV